VTFKDPFQPKLFYDSMICRCNPFLNATLSFASVESVARTYEVALC